MKRRTLWIGGGLLMVALVGLATALSLDRIVTPRRAERTAAAPAGEATAHITATLYYGSSDGQGLVPVKTEVPLAEPQGARILTAQFGAPPKPYVQVIPKGTTLRAFYVTDQGDAFVDVSRHLSEQHPGGSLMELLTVQAIVHAVTANLPTVKRVQILVDGKEVDTIAGHVDVRRPLVADSSLVREAR
jgi:hypothetical protein